MILDPGLSLLGDLDVSDLHQGFQINERKRIEVETSDQQAAAVDGGHFGVQHRAVPLVDGDTGREQPPIQAPRGRSGERDVAPTGEQQTDLNAASRRGDDGANDASVRQKVAVGDVNALPCSGESHEVQPTQAPPSSETGQMDAQRAVDRPA